MDIITSTEIVRRQPDGRDARASRILRAVADGGGIVRSSALRGGGFNDRAVADLVAAGQLVRVRRVWVASPNADRELVRAASEGVTLTCVTQAHRLGLWVLDASERHVTVGPHASYPRTDALVHWSTPFQPRHPHALVDSIENVLIAVARCQAFEIAVAVWDSAFNKALVQRDALGRLGLPRAIRRVWEASTPFSDSGLETFFRLRLGWLRLSLRMQIWLAGHRVDLLIGDRLVVQIDGGHHVGAQRASDIAHDAQLMLMGYHVIRVGYDQIINHWPDVQDLITAAVARGLHLAR